MFTIRLNKIVCFRMELRNVFCRFIPNVKIQLGLCDLLNYKIGIGIGLKPMYDIFKVIFLFSPYSITNYRIPDDFTFQDRL